MRLAYQYCVRQLTDLTYRKSAGNLLVGLIWLSVLGLLTEDRLIDDRGVALITLISTSLWKNIKQNIYTIFSNVTWQCEPKNQGIDFQLGFQGVCKSD